MVRLLLFTIFLSLTLAPPAPKTLVLDGEILAQNARAIAAKSDPDKIKALELVLFRLANIWLPRNLGMRHLVCIGTKNSYCRIKHIRIKKFYSYFRTGSFKVPCCRLFSVKCFGSSGFAYNEVRVF